MNIKRKGWSRQSDRGVEFLEHYIFQENYVAIIPPQKKSQKRNIALYQASENQGDLSQKSLWEWASLVLLLSSTHFFHYSVTEICILRVFSHLYSIPILQAFEIPYSVMCSSFLAKSAWNTLTIAICIWTFTFLLHKRGILDLMLVYMLNSTHWQC